MRLSCPVFSMLACLALLAPSAGFAGSQQVDSVAALQKAINEASAGDTITLKDGIYTTAKAITVSVSGTEGKPVTIAAENISGVEITGTHGFTVTGSASYIVISGFKFTHASGKNTIGMDTSQVRFTRNIFQCSGDGPYLSVLGNDAQIDYNEFSEKKTTGSMIAVSGSGGQVARRLWIHHNYFHDLSTAGVNGAEMIRFGLSALGLSTGAGLVEHNLFSGCRGENDLISNRSSGNTYRYNTLLDSPSAQFTLRHGNDCIVYGNYFRNTEGLRVFGDRHQITSNYLEGNYIGINIGNGDAEVADGAALTAHDRPDNCLIAFNTFIDNRTHYQLSHRSSASLGATATTFANNILVGGDVAAKIEAPYTDAVWSGNLLWNTGRPGDFPPEGFKQVDPMLVADANGIKRLQPDSPAIAAATGGYPGIAFDMDGQPRPGKKSVGADEISTAPVTARVLTVADVGPAAPEASGDTQTAVPATPPVEAGTDSPEPAPQSGTGGQPNEAEASPSASSVETAP